MKKIKRFGRADFEEFQEFANNGLDLYYINKAGKLYSFHLEPGGIGYELFDYDTNIDYEYETLEKMINTHIMPDGVSFKDVYNGENYFTWEGLQEYRKNNS